MTHSPDLLWPAEVAKRFGISPTQVSRLADAGKIPFQRTPGGSRRFRLEDIEQLERELGIVKAAS